MGARRSLRAGAALACAALLALPGCGSEKQPLRIGVIYDCVGAYRGFAAAELAGAELPLIQRGAKRLGSSPVDGVGGVKVAGRPVRLLTACSESGEFTTLIEQVRRLVEVEKADAIVVGGPLSLDGVALKQVARLYPDVVFVPAMSGAREITLHRPERNVYRVAPDGAQATAGLAGYAFRTLGWRRVAVVVVAWDDWNNEAAFTGEFCALGGRVERVQLDIFDPSGGDVKKLPRDVDGVAVLSGPVMGPEGFLRKLAATEPRLARHVVLGPNIVGDPDLMRAISRSYAGVVASSLVPAAGGSPAVRAYLREYRRAFPGLEPATALGSLTTGDRNAVEALVLALERANGDLPRDGQSFRGDLATLRASLLGVPVRTGANRQATVSASVVRILAAGGTAPVATIPGVDQSVGGLLAPDVTPSDSPPACRRGPPPPWAG